VVTTLSIEDLEQLIPDAARRTEWARRQAGAPRPKQAEREAAPTSARRHPIDRTYARHGLCSPDSKDEEAGLVDWVEEWAGANNAANLALARAVCERCPVRAECRADSLDGPDTGGIWAGTTLEERKALKRKAYNRSRRSAAVAVSA
jgi:transcription factor WhiB